MRKKVIYSSNGLILTPGAVDLAKDHLGGTLYLTYAQNEAYAKTYEDRFGSEAPLLGMIGYTDIELLFYAIDEAESIDPLTLVMYIKSLDSFSGRFETVDINEDGDIALSTVIEKWQELR